MEENREDLVLLLLREGSKNHAIKLYQEEMGVSFLEARQSVAEMANRHGVASRFNAARAVMLVVLALLLGACFAL